MSIITIKKLPILKSLSDLYSLPQGKLLINTINAHSFNIAKKDCDFAEILLSGDVLLPDGAGIVKAVKWLRGEKIERIAGWDLFIFEMDKLNKKGGKCFFLGSSEKNLSLIKEKTKDTFPNIFVETYSPPYKPEFTDEENKTMIDAINIANPDLLWIGMTAPKQEKWVSTNFNELKINCHIGAIGAVFDFYAGTIKRAPIWMQKHSLEWLYRLMIEPKRMWKRYLVGNFKFCIYVLKEKYCT